MNRRAIEQRLADQLRRDRRRPSRCRIDGGVVVVEPSGTAVGLAIAVAALTGETDTNAVMDRVAADVTPVPSTAAIAATTPRRTL